MKAVVESMPTELLHMKIDDLLNMCEQSSSMNGSELSESGRAGQVFDFLV